MPAIKKEAILARFAKREYPNAIARALGCSRGYVYTVLRGCYGSAGLKQILAERRLSDAKAD